MADETRTPINQRHQEWLAAWMNFLKLLSPDALNGLYSGVADGDLLSMAFGNLKKKTRRRLEANELSPERYERLTERMRENMGREENTIEQVLAVHREFERLIERDEAEEELDNENENENNQNEDYQDENENEAVTAAEENENEAEENEEVENANENEENNNDENENENENAEENDDNENDDDDDPPKRKRRDE